MANFCGIRLSTFGIVIGWINLIGGVITTIFIIAGFTRLDYIVKNIEDQMKDPSTDDVGIRQTVIIALSLYLLSSIATIIASAMLIVGIKKERHLLMAPWLTNALIFIFLNIVINLIRMIYLASGSLSLVIILFCISLALQCAVWYAIYSLFKKIRANRDLQQGSVPASSNTH